VDEVCCSHFAYGWKDHIAVRVLVNEEGEVTPSNITGVFRWIAGVALDLAEQHSIYDGSDHSELQHDEALTIVEQSLADIRDDAENAVEDGKEGARLVPEWITAEYVLRRMYENDIDTPQENYSRYEETVTAVWELADQR
jgi:hypothetical protein